MGSNRDTSTSQQSSSSQTVTPTAEQTELNKLQLNQAKEFDPIQRQLNTNAGNLVNQLLLGQGNLPGFLSKLPSGISPEVTQGLVDNSLRDVNAQLAKSGAGSFMDSGVAQSIGARTAGDIRLNSEQYNLQNLYQLLNLGISGQTSIQSPTLSTSSMLSQRLAGLNSVNQTGTSTSNSRTSYNPFLESFYSSAGSGLGNFFNPQTYYKPGCWVAAEIFGGWSKLKTRFARIFIQTKAPAWFRSIYMKHGEAIATFIRDKEWIKNAIRPMFESFAVKGGYYAI